MHSVAGVFRDGRIWLMCLIYFCFVMGQYGLTFWMPTLVKATGVTGNLNIGLISAIPFICAVVAMNLFGRSADWHRERRWHLVVPALLGAIGFVVARHFFRSDYRHRLPVAGRGRSDHLRATVLVFADRLSGRNRCRSRHRAHQLGGQSRRLRQPISGRLPEGSDRATHVAMYVLAAILVAGAILVLTTPPKLVNRDRWMPTECSMMTVHAVHKEIPIATTTIRVAVIGLGSMGFGMATSLKRAGFEVFGFDVDDAAVTRFVAEGGQGALTPAQAAERADVVVSVVVNAAQTEAILFGAGGAAETLAEGAVFVSSATMDPDVARKLAARLHSTGRLYLDAPISGGSVRAADGALTILASGSAPAFAKARPVLDAMAAKIYELGEEPGVGAAFKMINQLLAGVHIAAASEAIAFAARQGLDIRKVYEVITASAGNSWMFENRVPHVLDGDYAPHSAVDIFVKDLGIIQDMARSAKFPVPVAAAALQMFLMTSAAGMGRDDDASVARLYAQITGTDLPGECEPSKDDLTKTDRPCPASPPI